MIRRVALAFLWAWLAVALAAYLFQFRGLAVPVLSLLGLA